jgi:hypothetical protein
MNRRSKMEELAGLLDGELDAARTEQLYAELKDDPQLRAEFQQQRQIKALLGQLPEYQSPDYLATRVLGDIAARRGAASVWRWRTLAAALGGFAVCLVLVGGVLYFNRGPQVNYLAQRQPVGNIAGEHMVSNRFGPESGLVMSPGDWTQLAVPASGDEKITGFLQFANKAHHYSTLVNAAEAAKPDLSSAILVLDGKVYYLDEAELAGGEGQE